MSHEQFEKQLICGTQFQYFLDLWLLSWSLHKFQINMFSGLKKQNKTKQKTTSYDWEKKKLRETSFSLERRGEELKYLTD